ncbi:histidine kinase OS=Streptomyces microflavus OX=1919 GN=Smic_40770 PE=4 SV=1 [Streptomyces microflavus]
MRDDGPGIPAELLPHVFERFARGDASRSRGDATDKATGTTTGSTGLGLAIVQAVVSAHGGRVRVDSAPGRTVFVVELPAEAGPYEHSQSTDTDTDSQSTATDTGTDPQSTATDTGTGTDSQSTGTDSQGRDRLTTPV